MADTLFLDQLQAAALLLDGQRKSEVLDRPPLICAVIQFQQRRSFLTASLRLILKIQLSPPNAETDDDSVQVLMARVMQHVVHNEATRRPDGSAFSRKCLASMMETKQWLDSVGDHALKVAALGAVSTPDVGEIMGFQQQQLTQQHESLGAIVSYLVRANYAPPAEFDRLLDQIRQLDMWNNLAIHYVPALVQFSASYGSEGASNREDASTMYNRIRDNRERQPWPLRNFQAMANMLWMAEYSSWFVDQDDTLLEGPGSEQEARRRNEALMQALRDGAFHCILSICSSCVPSDSYSPARKGLIHSLLGEAPVLPAEPAPISPYFRGVIMESLEVFTQSFISNMPDTLRKFKLDEEDQRRRNLASFQPNMEVDSAQEDRHLERFFVIISYAYEGRPSAALVFWEDPESNYYGFLQWFSRRVSTPIIGAFCEGFRSISEGETCAGSAHRFLLEDSGLPASRARRATCLTWSQIFEELEFYASKVRELPGSSTAAPTPYPGKPKAVESDEPETPVMLECYLQLTAHLCRENADVRAWMRSQANFNMLDTAFLLCHASVPARVRACAFACVQALLTEKTTEQNDAVWMALDHWVSTGFTQGLQVHRPTRGISASSSWAEDMTFDAVSSNFDEIVAFVSLLQQMVSPPIDANQFNDVLPFPEQLGSSHRMPGIEPYVDLVMGKIFANKVPRLEGPHSYVLAFRCLQFIETCLDTFNEELLSLSNRSNMNFDDYLSTSSLAAYVRLHPFTRVMEWLFNEKVVATLFKLAHEDIVEIEDVASDSPRMKALSGSIRVMILVMDLQTTFLDIVRPIVKSQATNRPQTVISPAIATFEDCISANLRVVVDVAYYCGSGNQELALPSIELLKRFSESRKLSVVQRTWKGSRVNVNKLISALQQNKDVEPIARALIRCMEVDEREFVLGPASPAFNTRYAILDFLETTLSAHVGQPSLAHALLGFECATASVSVSPNGLFAKRSSLFHAVLDLSLEYPDSLGDSFIYWCVSLKSKAARIVQLLWSSPLTSMSVLADMRIGGSFSTSWLKTTLINPGTMWDGLTIQENDFLFEESAPTLERYLVLRSIMLAYTSSELRSIAGKGFAALNTEMVATLLGRTLTDAGEIVHSTVFDLLDFLEVQPAPMAPPPDFEILVGIDIDWCMDQGPAGSRRFNMELLEQLLAIQEIYVRTTRQNRDEVLEERIVRERADVCAYASGWNNYQIIDQARTTALEAWADLVSLLIINEQIVDSDRATLVLQVLQLISPKMEVFAYSNKPEGLVFARLTQALFAQLDLVPDELHDERAAEVAGMRLFQLFKICLKAVTNPEATPALRETLYNIGYQHLLKWRNARGSANDVLNAVKAVGDGLIDVMCDDAYGGTGAVRVAASLLLASMAELASRVSNPYMVDSLLRNNFMIVLVDTIRDVPSDLARASTQGKPHVKTRNEAALTLTPQRCQSFLRPSIADSAFSWPSVKQGPGPSRCSTPASSPPSRRLACSPQIPTSGWVRHRHLQPLLIVTPIDTFDRHG